MAERQPNPPITCSGCSAEWTAAGAAHCAADGCHRTFASAGLFDAHRAATRDTSDLGRCLNPAQVYHNGKRVLFYRDGMWRGPSMDAATVERMRAVTR